MSKIIKVKKPKVSQLYNIDSIIEVAEKAKEFTIKDSRDGVVKQFADAGIMLPRELEYVSTTIYKQRYANLSFLNESGITVNNEGGVKDRITKKKFAYNGDFRTAGDNTNVDGKISIEAQSDTIPVIHKEAESDWSDTEVQRAQEENINLPAEFVDGHNMKYNQQIDARGFTGDNENTNLEGLLNYSGFATTPATGVFSGLSPQQMYDDVSALVIAQRGAVDNDEVFSAMNLACSPGIYNLLSFTILNTAAGPMNVRDALIRNLNVRFVTTFRATSLGVIVAYSSDDRAMLMRIPGQLRFSNIDQRGFKYYIESDFRVGGLDVIEDQAGYILTGVE